jgi:hypothetical protein
MPENKSIKEREYRLNLLTSAFCDEYLDQDHKELMEKIILKLRENHSDFFMRGKSTNLAAAIIHAIGSINFLFDNAFEPYVSVKELNNYYGTNRSTVSNKSAKIRNLLKLDLLNHEFSAPQMKDNHPLDNLLKVDGFFISLDSFPVDFQRHVKEVRAKGLDIVFSSEEKGLSIEKKNQ